MCGNLFPRVRLAGALLLAIVPTAFAQQSAPAATAPAPEAKERDLASQVVDPTAPLKTLTFQYKEVSSFHGISGHQSEFDFKVSVPFQAWGVGNIFKVTLPYVTGSKVGPAGLGDTTLFDLAVLPQSWGRLGVGLVTSFGVDRQSGKDTFSFGPAIGAVLPRGKWTYGLFNQNLFSGDVTISQFQPILAYTFSPQVSVSMGDAQFVLDWKKSDFVQIPLGVQVNYITALKGQPIRLFINPQYNLRDRTGTSEWSTTIGLALIVR